MQMNISSKQWIREHILTGYINDEEIQIHYTADSTIVRVCVRDLESIR